MNTIKYYYVYALLMFILTGCHESPTKPNMEVEVATTIVEQKDIPAILEYVGVASSSRLVEIRARVDGYLQKIAYDEGALVHEGDLLFLIDPKPFEAVLAQARGLRNQQEALLWQTQRAVERIKPLYEKDAASLKDLDNATAAALSAQAMVDSAQASELAAEINLGYTKVYSPLTGISDPAKYREGALVGPTYQQTLLTTIYAMDPIWIDFSISEGDLLKFRKQERSGILAFPKDMDFDVEIVLSDGTSLPNYGKVDFANPTLQQNTGSMIVRATVSNTDSILRPGQFLRARLHGAIYPKALAVPQRAVMQGKSGLFVYVLNAEDQVEMRSVVSEEWYNDLWIISSGLKPGDEVVVDGVNKVFPGMKVKKQSNYSPQRH